MVENHAQACACGGACNYRDIVSHTSCSSQEVDSDMKWDDLYVILLT